MNETNNEDWQEMPVTVEEVPADSEEIKQTDTPSNTEDFLLDDSEEEVSADDLLNTEDSFTTLTEEMTEDLSEQTVDLSQIHFDLCTIIFLLLFFWLYDRIKAGIRNFKKFTNK